MVFVDDKGRLFGKINIIDLFIVLVVTVLLGGMYAMLFTKNTKDAAHISKVLYDIEVKNVSKNFVNAINTGEPIRDSVRGNNLGIVVNKIVYSASAINMDMVQGKYVKVEIPDLYDVKITVEADANITPTDILVDGTDIRVGKQLSIKGKGYANVSFVLKVSLYQQKGDQYVDGQER
ncbi:DUF4330 domain-containing protein [Lutispora sp.]|uniref:DUF4330 domain-containing protein n=1 Tax=Lutispora sp. TaxID=2828727 RepID=UPI0035649D6C